MNVDVVIVTYNRLEKLKKTLQCYENQTQPFRNLIVVNNHSTDGTFDYLEDWRKKEAPFEKHIITTSDNLGGAGGFYTGEKYAMTMNPDWVFIADDDAYPEPDMMEEFYKFAKENDIEKYSAVCAAVCNIEGEIFTNHRSYIEVSRKIHFKKTDSALSDYEKRFFEIDALSYVGPFLNAKALKKVGLVDPKYFIFYDDTEHSIRLSKFGKLICVPRIRIKHDTGMTAKNTCVATENVLSWHDYYFRRNEMALKIKHYPLVALNHLRRQLPFIMAKHDTEEEILIAQALKDAWLKRMGKHSKYKPGWSAKKDNK